MDGDRDTPVGFPEPCPECNSTGWELVDGHTEPCTICDGFGYVIDEIAQRLRNTPYRHDTDKELNAVRPEPSNAEPVDKKE